MYSVHSIFKGVEWGVFYLCVVVVEECVEVGEEGVPDVEWFPGYPAPRDPGFKSKMAAKHVADLRTHYLSYPSLLSLFNQLKYVHIDLKAVPS